MTDEILITNARMVNEGAIQEGDLLVRDGRIEKIAPQISAGGTGQVLDAAGRLLMPGMIDDQVHFREPGAPHKGGIRSESRAAVAGASPVSWKCPTPIPRR
jgi:dihydroorotase